VVCSLIVGSFPPSLGPTLGGYKHVGGDGLESLAGVYVDMDGFGCVLILFCCRYIFFLFLNVKE